MKTEDLIYVAIFFLALCWLIYRKGLRNAILEIVASILFVGVYFFVAIYYGEFGKWVLAAFMVILIAYLLYVKKRSGKDIW